MISFRKRQRKFVTLVALGCWLFAFAVGVVAACDLLAILPVAPSIAAAPADQHAEDCDMAPGCAQFCANDLPIPAKTKAFQPQPAMQAVLLAPLPDAALMPAGMPAVSAFDPHPPPGPPLYARFVRLTL